MKNPPKSQTSPTVTTYVRYVPEPVPNNKYNPMFNTYNFLKKVPKEFYDHTQHTNIINEKFTKFKNKLYQDKGNTIGKCIKYKYKDTDVDNIKKIIQKSKEYCNKNMIYDGFNHHKKNTFQLICFHI